MQGPNLGLATSSLQAKSHRDSTSECQAWLKTPLAKSHNIHGLTRCWELVPENQSFSRLEEKHSHNSPTLPDVLEGPALNMLAFYQKFSTGHPYKLYAAQGQ